MAELGPEVVVFAPTTASAVCQLYHFQGQFSSPQTFLGRLLYPPRCCRIYLVSFVRGVLKAASP